MLFPRYLFIYIGALSINRLIRLIHLSTKTSGRIVNIPA